MDNLTHSLAGALLGQMGLKHKTRFGTPALIIAANLPDLDAWSVVLGPAALALRRGATHGPVAMVVLTLALAALLMLYARWRPNPHARPLHRGWLLGLCFVGMVSHPTLDWLNSYGVRWLEPFSSQWFAADTLFIIDVWIWVTLTVCVIWSLKRERRGDAGWRRPAMAGAGAVLAYIVANGLISERAEAIAHDHVHQTFNRKPTLVVANPLPLVFWQRHMLWRDHEVHGYGSYSAFGSMGHVLHPPSTNPSAAIPLMGFDPATAKGAMAQGVWLDHAIAPHHASHVGLIDHRAANPDAKAFLFWSRMPIVQIDGSKATLNDQRFAHPVIRQRFTVQSDLSKAAAKP
jgi:inner membrane protein